MVMPAGMAIPRHRHIDDIRLDPALLLIAKSPIAQHAGAEILDHDVGLGNQALNDFEALDGADVQTEALLVDIGVVEISRRVEIDLKMLWRRRARQTATFVLRPLDLDDLGAKSA